MMTAQFHIATTFAVEEKEDKNVSQSHATARDRIRCHAGPGGVVAEPIEGSPYPARGLALHSLGCLLTAPQLRGGSLRHGAECRPHR